MTAFFALTVLCAASAHGDPGDARLQETIRFECRALHAPRALAELSKVAGIRLEASPQLTYEPLIISVRDVPLSAVLEKIAQAMSAEWLTVPGGYRLYRSADLERRQEREHYARRAEAIRKSQVKLRERLDQAGPFDASKAKSLSLELGALAKAGLGPESREMPNWQVMQGLSDRSPAGILSMKVASQLDPDALARIEPSTQRVFSLRPNPTQLPLPASCEAAFAEFGRDLETLLAAMPDLGTLPEFAMLSREVQTLFELKRTADVSPKKLLVKVGDQGMMSPLAVEVIVANGNGETLGRNTVRLVSPDYRDPTVQDPDEPPLPQESPIELSPHSKELLETLGRVMKGQWVRDAPTSFSPEVRDVLLNPESRCIEEFVASDAFLSTARTRNVNVVASSNDFFGITAMFLAMQPKWTPESFLRRAESEWALLRIERSPGWLVFSVADPLEARQTRMDPAILGRIYRAGAEKNVLTLEESAEFAAASPTTLDASLYLLRMMLVAPNVVGALERSDSYFLRLYRTLTPTQIAEASGSVGLRVERLRPEQRALLERMVYHSRKSPSVSWTATSDEDDPRPYFYSLAFEPTERFPNGLPRDASLTLSVANSDVVRASGTIDGRQTSSTLSLGGLAHYLLSVERPNEIDNGARPTYSKFRAGLSKEHSFRLRLDRGMSYHSVLAEEVFTGPSVSSPDQLPPEVWKKVQEQMARYRESLDQRKPPVARRQ